VRQAEQLMGKSFMEIMQVLVPAHEEQAAINIGRDQVLHLPLQRLCGVQCRFFARGRERRWNRHTPERSIEAKTRADAFKLLEQTAAFYKMTSHRARFPISSSGTQSRRPRFPEPAQTRVAGRRAHFKYGKLNRPAVRGD
jgi:type VI secretion system protein ImpA